MCGIWTYLGNESSLNTLVQISHRGPDDFGQEVFKTPAGLLEMASWRLSIIDLSSMGHMPMQYNDRYWIVYNGEVFNYLELRDDLKAKGYHFRSNTDTEVIMAAYAEYGVACLNKFNGMFAFCLWDNTAKTLFVARDRFGVKPLYYYNGNDGIAFASEIKQFLGLPKFSSRLNIQRANDFLVYGFLDHTEETLFRNVYQLRGGEYIFLSLCDWKPGSALQIKSWYSLTARDTFKGTFENAAEQYKALLTDSVRLRLRSDVPIGSCLSGGMDSSSIVCSVNKLLNYSDHTHSQKTFSSCFEDKRYDERHYMEEVVSNTQIMPHYVYPDVNELFETIDKIVWFHDEPYNSTSIFAQWNVFRAAKQKGITVMLDGQGGDEQLGSYPQYFSYHIIDLLNHLQILTAIREAKALKRVHQWHYMALCKSLGIKFIPRVGYHLWKRGVNRSKNKWLNREFMRFTEYSRSKTADLLWEINRPGNAFELARMNITRTTLPMLLHWEDRNSMANSVEARVPFLDYRLMEFALGLPEEYKTFEGVTKRVLRKSMSDVVPRKILTRMDKMGFVTPEEVWVSGNSAKSFKDILLKGASLFPELFNVKELSDQFDEFVKGNRTFTHLFWRVISFSVWGRLFKVTL